MIRVDGDLSNLVITEPEIGDDVITVGGKGSVWPGYTSKVPDGVSLGVAGQ